MPSSPALVAAIASSDPPADTAAPALPIITPTICSGGFILGLMVLSLIIWFGLVRLVAQPGAVSLDRVAQQYARATTGIATDQLWAALRQWGAATLTGRERLLIIRLMADQQ